MIILDGKKFIDREKSYTYLNEKFDFDYNVKNLDALYDSLSMLVEEIEIIDYAYLVKNMGDYGYKILRVFLDCAVKEELKVNFINYWLGAAMYEKSKYMEIRNFVALNVINRRLKDGDKLYDKEFLINKFRINPSYVERAYKIMLEENLIEKRSDYYYMTIDENKIRSLKNEFANLYVNDYLNKMQKIGADLTEAFSYLAMRMNANG